MQADSLLSPYSEMSVHETAIPSSEGYSKPDLSKLQPSAELPKKEAVTSVGGYAEIRDPSFVSPRSEAYASLDASQAAAALREERESVARQQKEQSRPAQEPAIAASKDSLFSAYSSDASTDDLSRSQDSKFPVGTGTKTRRESGGSLPLGLQTLSRALTRVRRAYLVPTQILVL